MYTAIPRLLKTANHDRKETQNNQNKKKQAELKEKTDQEKQARIKAESESALISKLNQKINTQGYLDLNKDNLQMLGFLWMYVHL